LFLSIPIVAFGIGYRESVLQTLFEWGQFDSTSTKGVSSVLPFYLVGLVSMCPAALISRTYFARHKGKQLSILAVISIGVYFVASGLLCAYYSYAGIGMAYSLYWLVFFVLGITFLDRKLIDYWFVSFTGKVLVNSIGALAAGYAFATWYGGSPLVNMAIAASVMAVAFVAMCRYVFWIPEAGRISAGLFAACTGAEWHRKVNVAQSV